MKRFVILGHVGNGARHLQQVLRGFPGVGMPDDPEIFSLLRHPPEHIASAVANPLRFLTTIFAAMAPSQPTAGGFILNYSDGVDSIHDAAAISDSVAYALDRDLPRKQGVAVQLVKKHGGTHAVSSRFFGLWRHLHSASGFAIVHLRRSNLLAGFFEVLAAMRNPPHTRHHIEPAFFYDYQRELQGHAQYVRQQFTSQPLFEAYYEDLRNDPEIARRLGDFLKLPGFQWAADVSPPPHPRTWLSNYDQWIAAMRDTIWQKQMEEITQAP